MILIIGLGNPGKKYKNTRHNVGFLTLDYFQKINNFPAFKLRKSFNSFISSEKIGEEKIILAKPQTFMNLSGQAIKKLFAVHCCAFTELLIVHDDIDLPLGKIKIVKNRGAAGHKGVESIIKGLGTKNFVRFRVGIKPKEGKSKNAEKFVLKKFFKNEEKIVKEVIKKTAQAIEFSIKEGLEKAMSKFNK